MKKVALITLGVALIAFIATIITIALSPLMGTTGAGVLAIVVAGLVIGWSLER
jgi:hypothetical protein